MRTRTETDTMGGVEVPADRYWGAQTQRALENFGIGQIRFTRPFIRAYGIIKHAAAVTNAELQLLSEEKRKWICDAAQEVI
ncbi:MAG: class II fumarate hydratase, partial [Planctomycetes bacterium]|nr:class II fumarate hydratase [Planctomycetota bacterium]